MFSISAVLKMFFTEVLEKKILWCITKSDEILPRHRSFNYWCYISFIASTVYIVPLIRLTVNNGDK